jgi:hypothetical protein
MKMLPPQQAEETVSSRAASRGEGGLVCKEGTGWRE